MTFLSLKTNHSKKKKISIKKKRILETLLGDLLKGNIIDWNLSEFVFIFHL